MANEERKFKVWNLDVWHNEEEGFWVNDRNCILEEELGFNDRIFCATEYFTKEILKRIDFFLGTQLATAYDEKKIRYDWESEFDCYLYDSNDEPLFQIELVQ